jgi:hypothetical protein
MNRSLLLLTLATALLAAPEAFAVDSSLGVSLGYVEAKRVDATLVFSGDYRFHLSKVIALAPEFSYWKVAVLPVGSRVQLFGGGGGGLHHVTGNLAIRGSGTASSVTDSITRGGFDVLAGVDIAAGDTLSFFLSARYDWVLGLEGDDPRRLDQAKFVGGFRVRF